MYSKASWGGAIDPYIEIKFNKVDEGQPIASLIIYEYKDYALIGRPNPNPMNEDDVGISIAPFAQETNIDIEYTLAMRRNTYQLKHV